MLGNNIKAFRRKKGYTQETLAEQLHVVRQTVSKWEKGLSVPDAELLERLAELFEVPVGVLLGAEASEGAAQEGEASEESMVVQQLAILNGQLAAQSARRRTLLRRCAVGAALALAALFLLWFLLFWFNRIVPQENAALTTTTLSCALNGETYLYEVTYDEQYRIFEAGGDAFIGSHVNTEAYDDANVLIAQIEDYFTGQGGTCETGQEVRTCESEVP